MIKIISTGDKHCPWFNEYAKRFPPYVILSEAASQRRASVVEGSGL